MIVSDAFAEELAESNFNKFREMHPDMATKIV